MKFSFSPYDPAKQSLRRHQMLMLLGIVLVIMKFSAVVHFRGVALPSVHSSAFAAIVMAVLGLVVLTGKELRIGLLLGGFCIVALESLLLNDVPKAMQGSEHLAYFILMLCLLSPLIESADLRRLRQWMWRTLIIGLRCVVAVSALLYIPFELNRVRAGAPFGGCVVMGMLLGILSAIVAIDSVWQMLQPRLSRAKLCGYSALLFVALVMVAASGSRCAILSTIVGIAILAVWQRKNRRMWLGMGCMAATLALLLVLTGGRSLGSAQSKIEIGISHGSLTYSRDHLWQMRLNEFTDSPIIGIGFATSYQKPGQYADKSDLQRPKKPMQNLREPGSSWLTVLSNVGLLGFGFFAAFNIILICRLRRQIASGDTYAWLMLAMLVALWIHGCFEGWVLYAGSITFMIYWLLTAQIYERHISDHL